MSVATSLSLSSPALRLWQPGNLPQRIQTDPRQFTVRECYSAYKYPTLAARGEDGIGSHKQYLNALNHWERLTSDPAASMVTDEMLLDFQSALIAEGRRSSATCNKIMRQLRGIFSPIGTRGPRNPAGKNLIELIPYVEPLLEEEPMKRTISDEHLEAIYLACDSAQWPKVRGVSPATWWRSLIVLMFNFGLRTNDLLSRSWIDIVLGEASDPARAHPEIRYLKFVPKKTRRRKPQPIYLPLVNPVVCQHLESLSRCSGLLLPKAKGIRYLYEVWQKIQEAAGIAPEEFYYLKNLRVTCNTRLDDVREGIGEWVLGHANRKNVNRQSYLQASEKMLKALRELPQPEIFLKGPDIQAV